ncbi:MAG: CFI-box-CTERM domain-containing protein [Crocinitomicaceae bacterium]
MTKNENLKKHVQNLCSVLNKNGIIDEHSSEFKESGEVTIWECDGFPEDVFGGGIACDTKAFNFLKKNGHIDIGVCWKCGNEPIDNTYVFTDGFDPSVKYYICKSCYGRGKRFQKEMLGEENNSKCYVATMCYGDINAPQVILLRKHRDEVMLKKVSGKALVWIYYRISPSFVRIMKDKPKINGFIKSNILDRIVRNIENS